MKQTHPYIVMAGCKTTDEFYKKYPTEQHFFGAHPEMREQISHGHMANGGSIEGPVMGQWSETPYTGAIPEQYFPHNFEAIEYTPSGHMQMGGNWQYPDQLERILHEHMQTGGFIMPAMNPVDLPTRYTEMATGGRIEVDKPGYHFDGTRMVQNHGSTYNPTSGAFFKNGGRSNYSQFGGYANMDGDIDEMGKGGIHIKPENKGKFNATKKATGKSTEELTHSSNPVTKKRAVFAQNASHWKHKEFGGLIQDNDYPQYDDSAVEFAEGGYIYGQGINPFTPLKQFMQMGGGKQDTDLTTDPITGGPIQPQQAPAYNPNNNAAGVAQAPPPPGVNTGNNWATGMTPEEVQASIGPDRNNTQAPVTNQHRGTNPYGQAFGNLLGAGLATASYFEDKRNQRNAQGYQRELGMSASQPIYAPPGGHGDYTQQGKFRPTQGIPSQSPAYNTMENGGTPQYQKGGTYDLSEEDINSLIRKGYKLEKI